MSGFPWLKLWNEAPTDPKWLAVAEVAGTSPSVAWHTFSCAMTFSNEQLSRGKQRGSITGFNLQVVAAFCRVTVDEIQRVIQAFRDMRILIGDQIASWKKRQDEKLPKPRSPGAERTARSRAAAAARAAQEELKLEPRATPIKPAEPAVTAPLEALHPTVTSAADTDSVISEAIASEREPPKAEVVQIDDHRKVRASGSGERKSRISPDWQPDEQDYAYAIGKGYDLGWVAWEAERFRDHHLKNGSRFADWNAAWRTWVQRAADFSRDIRSRPAAGGTQSSSILAAFSRIDDFREAN
jgi:hypothetical protein